MRAKSMLKAGALVLLAVRVMGAGADDKRDYDRRTVARYLGLFHSLDRNADDAVTRRARS